VKAKCSDCGSVFEATGGFALNILLGGVECSECHGNVNQIYASLKDLDRCKRG